MSSLENGMVYDELTGVLSFKSFLSETHRILDEDLDTEYMLLVWDIERFKVVNDIFGMDMGDKVLCDLVNTFRRDIFRSGIIGRVGGDKFISLCIKNDTTPSLIKDKMRYTIETDTEKYRLFVQAGVYYIEDRRIPVIKMCDRAIIALNSIKGIHTDRVAVYNETKREELVTWQHLVSDMEKGIANKEFFVVVQPIYDVKNGSVAAGEVLVRWQHPKYGLLMPGSFVPVFEKNFMINKLDHYVWEEACRIIRTMIDNGENVVPLSINVSRANLYYDDLVATLDGLVKKYNIPEGYLRVEITETAYMDNPQRLINTVNELKSKGYIVLMDDFGTGYSSLNLLKDLSFDILKVDKKLIDEIVTSDRASNVVSSVVKMAKWLGMSVVAEGVETSTQAVFLKNIGSEYIQGYLYSKPVSEQEFLEKCKENADNYCRDAFNDIDIDNILNIKDARVRTFLDEIIGPMALYEYDEEDIRLISVNSEYIKMHKTTPHELYLNDKRLFSDEENYSKQRIIGGCISARCKNDAESIIVNRKSENGEWLWLNITIRYVGDMGGKSRFLFSLRDVTKEQNRRNQMQIKGYYPLLCHIYMEVSEMNYTDGTITTLYKDDGNVQRSNRKAPLKDMLEMFVRDVVAEESRDEFITKTSEEYIDEFFNCSKRMYTFDMKVRTRNGQYHNCEMTVIKNSEIPGKKSVIACSRVIERC